MPPVGWALILCGALAFANWGQWQAGRALQAQAETVTQERDLARAGLATALDAQKRAAAAERARLREITRLRSAYEQAARDLAALPDDGCLDRRVPDGVFEPPAGGEPGPDPAADAGPAPGAALDRPDVPRRAAVRAPPAGICPELRGGQSRRAVCA